MAIPFIGELISQGFNLIDSIGDKIAPDKNVELKTEADILKFTESLKAEYKLKVMDKVLEEGSDLNKSILDDLAGARQHEVDLAKMEPPLVRYVTSLLRGIFRPVIGFGILGSFAFSRFIAPYFGAMQIQLTQWDYTIVGLIVTFYFGGRTIEKIRNPQGISPQLSVQNVK
jgi:hypothetical protein